MHQTSAQQIPDTADPLARAYLDALSRAEGVKMLSMLQRTGGDSLTAFMAELDADPDPDAPHLRADLAAAAVLTARAIAAEPGLAGRLRRGDGPIVTIQTHMPELVDLVSEVIEHCATSDTTSRKLIVARDGSDKGHTPMRGNQEVVRAMHQKRPVVGISPDPKRHLPSSLLRLTEYRLALPVLDEWAVQLVIEAVAGKPYSGAIDADLVRLADLSDLNLALRRDLTPGQCLERLADIVTSKATYLGDDGPTLEDLDGYGDAKAWGLELASDLKDLRAGRLEWVDLDHKGLLLSGPPGTGKTSFAKALAKSAGVPLIATSVADWNSAAYLSGTLQAIRNVFAEARRQAPAVLFIDELDGISSRATLTGEYVEYWMQIVNCLLESLAGVSDREGVVVVGATNYPDKIDAAVLRAGRLDQHIELQKPDIEALTKILRYHVGAETLANVDLLPAALAGRGGTGADVEAWVRRAKAAARRARRDLHLDDLLEQIRAGRAVLTADVRRRVAVHEIGHVLVGSTLRVGNLVGVSVHDLGGTAQFEDVLNGATTKDLLERHIALALAGRAAEQVIFGDVGIGSGSGPTSDLAKATRLAQLLETQYGFGAYGCVFIGDSYLDNLPRYPGLLEAVKKRLDVAIERSQSILSARRDDLVTLSGELDRLGYLSKDDIDTLLAKSAVSSTAIAEAAE